MPTKLDWTTLDLTKIIRPGDRIVCGDGPAEPLRLTRALVEQRHRLGGIGLFIGTSLGDTLGALDDDLVRVTTYNGATRTFDLFAKGRLDILPVHYSQLGRYMEEGPLPVDVVFLHVAPADEDGNYNLGAAVGYLQRALKRARTVVAMVNERMPRTAGDVLVPAARIDYLLECSEEPAQILTRAPNAVETAIAEHISRLVSDRSVLQLGIGTLPDAIAKQLTGKRDLGLHSGLLGEGIIDLIESGAVTNRYKEIDTGLTVSSLYFGTARMYRFLDRNPDIRVRCSSHTHGARPLANFERLMSINSAIEVDLTGQANGETIDGRYIGTLGGQGDFQRAALQSKHGRGIIALPATAGGGKVSRIVARVSGPVTTARGDADIVVTEYGIADLRGRTLEERARAMVAIAHPDHRAGLGKALSGLF